MDISKSTADQSTTRFMTKVKSVSSRGDLKSDYTTSTDNVLKVLFKGVKRQKTKDMSINDKDGEESEDDELDIPDISEYSLDPDELNLQQLFSHSGSGSKDSSLGRYQKLVLCLVLSQSFLNSFMFFGIQALLLVPPNTYSCSVEGYPQKICKFDFKKEDQQFNCTDAESPQDSMIFISNHKEECDPVEEEYFQSWDESIFVKLDLSYGVKNSQIKLIDAIPSIMMFGWAIGLFILTPCSDKRGRLKYYMRLQLLSVAIFSGLIYAINYE